jgi:carbon storage regulator
MRRSPVGNEEGAPMLVLTRKSNQSIMIGDEIEVSVLSVMGEKVRIGIQAPQKVPVFRKEIYLEIHRESGVTAQDGNGAGEKAEVESAQAVDESLRELGEGA